jgi:hypothetical protein
LLEGSAIRPHNVIGGLIFCLKLRPVKPPPSRQVHCLMKLSLVFIYTASTAALFAAAAPVSNTSAPIRMSAADRVPWSNLADLEHYAAMGNLKACAQLGEQLLRGDGIAQNIPRALTVLERAAKGGVGSAAFRLGMVYDDGQGVTRDRQRALDYFRAAAAVGEAEAFYNIGAAYIGARGVKRDYTEGLAWIILATRRGAGGDTEQNVRARIKRLRHPEWITAAEQRAPDIERELAATTPAALLAPPAPITAPTAEAIPAPRLAPTLPKPAAPAPIAPFKPDLPALQPPTLPAPNP